MNYIDIGGDIEYGPVGLDALDLINIGVNGVNVPLESEFHQVHDDLVSHIELFRGGPHYGHGLGLE